MWVLRMAYTFFYGLMIKIHESMFGFICHGLLIYCSSMTFTNIFGAFSFITAFILLAYLIINVFNLNYKMNGKNQKSQLWIANHMTPLVVRQGFINLDPNSESKYFLKKNFNLFNYFKKLAIIFSIFFGNSSPNFQLGAIILVYSISLFYIIYLRPYRSHFYTFFKLLSEISVIILCYILLVATNRLNQLMQ